MTAHPWSMKHRASHSCTTQPSTQLLGRLCVQFLFDRLAPRLTSRFPPVLHPGLVPVSQSLSVSSLAHRGWCPHGILGMSSDIGGTRPGKYGSPCLRQELPETPVYYSYYLPHICPSSDPNPQSFLNVRVSVHGWVYPVLTMVGQKKTALVRRNRQELPKISGFLTSKPNLMRGVSALAKETKTLLH